MIYFDNSATTKPCGKTVEMMNKSLEEVWGNPSSLHLLGVEAEALLNDTRSAVSSFIGCLESEIYFTSSGTEANNIAVFGAARQLKKRGNRIVTTAIEHPSVLNPMRELENEGFEVIYLKPDAFGKVSKEDIFSAVNDKTVLVSVMLVNNETGAVQNVECIKKAVAQSGAPALIHTDCVQAFGKMKVNCRSLGADLISVSGHKIHGPKGIGALYIKKGTNIKPIILGGGQEKGIRSGTEPTPLIAGFLGALGDIGDIAENRKRVAEISSFLREQLSLIECVKINSPKDALPYILNFSLVGYRSETVLHFLEERGIFVSSGSACSKGKASNVLGVMGLSDREIDSSVRLSFSRFNTISEAETFIKEIKNATKCIRKAY